MNALVVLGVFIGGMALDWAIYSRIATTLGQPAPYDENDGYLRQLKPRVIIAFAALVLFCWAQLMEQHREIVMLLAITGFVLSPCYGAYRYLNGD